MRRFNRALALTLFFGGLLARPALAQENNSPAAWRQALQTYGQRNDVRAYTRQCPNGANRVYLNVSGAQDLRAMEQLLHNRSNVLEVCHIGNGGGTHSLFIFDRQLIHFQYLQGTNNWRLRNWGYGLRPSANKLYSAMIQLTPSEGQKLRTMLSNAAREQGNDEGRWAQDGHIQNAMGQRGFNCTSVISGVPIGDRGESLSQLVGLGGASGDPRGFQRSLESNANERVFGICIYGPDMPDFGRNQNQDVFTFF